MANSWLRLWHDMPNDPKWRTIARVSKQPITAVLSVYVHLLVIASNATERGRTQNVCSEDLASALDLDAEQIDVILSAMQGRVLDGDMVSGWAKRQVEREDGSAERAKRWREAQKEAKQAQANAAERKQTPDTDTDTEHKTSSSSGKPEDRLACPAEKIIDLYHERMPMNPRCKILNESRRGAIRQRWKEAATTSCKPFGYSSQSDGLAAWAEFFSVCAESDFLTGRVQPKPGQAPFLADIDFLFSPKGFAKCLENKYHRETA